MTSLADSVSQFQTDVATAHQIVNGDASTTVTTAGGPVRSLAKLIADNQNIINAGLGIPAGELNGTDVVQVSRSSGLLSTTLQKIAAWVLSLVCPQVATFASIPASPTGFYLVLADETKSGNPTIYFFTASHRYWLAMVQDA